MSCQDNSPVKHNSPELYLRIGSFQSEISVEWWWVDFTFPKTGSKCKKVLDTTISAVDGRLTLAPARVAQSWKDANNCQQFSRHLCQVWDRTCFITSDTWQAIVKFLQLWKMISEPRAASDIWKTLVPGDGYGDFNHSEWKNPWFGHIIPFLVTNILGFQTSGHQNKFSHGQNSFFATWLWKVSMLDALEVLNHSNTLPLQKHKIQMQLCHYIVSGKTNGHAMKHTPGGTTTADSPHNAAAIHMPQYAPQDKCINQPEWRSFWEDAPYPTPTPITIYQQWQQNPCLIPWCRATAHRMPLGFPANCPAQGADMTRKLTPFGAKMFICMVSVTWSR